MDFARSGGGGEDVEENVPHSRRMSFYADDCEMLVTSTKDKNTTSEAAEQSGANWEQMLAGLKVARRAGDGSAAGT